MILFDRVPAENVRLTDDGYLVGEARVARTGIQEYLASEMGITDGPDRIVKVYRPEDEVFQQDAMKSYAYRPVTVDHPPEMVNADNWREYSRGQTGADVARDGETIRVPMVLMDKQAIQEWEDGKRELSMGYTSEIEFSDGVTPDGEKYDAIQRNMKMNHLALVARARGGSQLRLGDRNHDDGVSSMDTKLRTITVDGFSVETTDAGAQAIERLQKQLDEHQSKLSDAEQAHKDALAAKDKEVAAKDAEIDDLKKKVMSDEDIDNEVRARADLIGKAKTVNDADYSGKSAADIRKACVVAKLGDKAIEGKSDAYIEARFDSLVEAAESDDPVRKVIQKGDGKPVNDAYEEYLGYLSTAHQNKEAH